MGYNFLRPNHDCSNNQLVDTYFLCFAALHWDLHVVQMKSENETSSPVHVKTDYLSYALDNVSKDHPPLILLDPSAQLSAGEFERLWLKMPPA